MSFSYSVFSARVFGTLEPTTFYKRTRSFNALRTPLLLRHNRRNTFVPNICRINDVCLRLRNFYLRYVPNFPTQLDIRVLFTKSRIHFRLLGTFNDVTNDNNKGHIFPVPKLPNLYCNLSNNFDHYNSTIERFIVYIVIRLM